jgi:hypothetical protein
MRVLLAIFALLFLGTAAANELFPDAPPGAGAFGPMMGDHRCVLTYRGPGGELNQTASCRWKWYYKFDGRMVQDDFWMYGEDGEPVWAGSTIRTWDLAKNQWNNMFLGVHDSGFGRMFHGVPVGDEVHLTVDGEDPDGRKHLNRIFFYDVEDGAFKWRQERSYDAGETWALWIKTEVYAPQ